MKPLHNIIMTKADGNLMKEEESGEMKESSKVIEEEYQENHYDQKIDASDAKWLNNENIEVEKVFGFNENAELVNARAAMLGFLMLIITELAFKGMPVTHSLFGIG
tara:strand:- start:187 stop:504 length:318 start_codon:yes stop_codon:yes gene_type:complete